MKNASLFNITKSGWNEDGTIFILDVVENGLFSGVFVPPPPRPKFLDVLAKTEDLPTCDLCSWAWKRSQIQAPGTSIGNEIDIPNQVEWLFSLIIVSIISASLGAIGMFMFSHCKRSKRVNSADTGRNVSRESTGNIQLEPSAIDLIDKEQIPTMLTSVPNTPENSVWCWLSRKSQTQIQLETITCSPVENHYTQMEEPYNNEEALYAELEVEGLGEGENRTSGRYQNQAYADPDVQISSAPSSAYYSDLSVTPIPEQAYEVVNLETVNSNWDNINNSNKPPSARLTAIIENVTVPSDYI